MDCLIYRKNHNNIVSQNSQIYLLEENSSHSEKDGILSNSCIVESNLIIIQNLQWAKVYNWDWTPIQKWMNSTCVFRYQVSGKFFHLYNGYAWGQKITSGFDPHWKLTWDRSSLLFLSYAHQDSWPKSFWVSCLQLPSPC